MSSDLKLQGASIARSLDIRQHFVMGRSVVPGVGKIISGKSAPIKTHRNVPTAEGATAPRTKVAKLFFFFVPVRYGWSVFWFPLGYIDIR